MLALSYYHGPTSFCARLFTMNVIRSLIRPVFLKSFGNIALFLLFSLILLPMRAFSEADRLKIFPEQVAIDDIVHIPTGEKVQFLHLQNFLDCARVIYVGEIHANKASHQVQLKVLKACYEKFGNTFTVGMEMFTRPYQPFLDQWTSGEIDEQKFLEDTHWDKEWGYDYLLYKDIFDFVREKKISLLALNAPKDMVRMVSKKGLKDLSEEEKRLLPEIDTSDYFHRVYLERAVREHVDHSAGLERYNDVQSLWEEYMAQTIATYLSSWEGKDKKILVFAGNGHIIYDFGIPKRVFRRNFLPYYTIYPAEFQGNKPTSDQNLFLADIPLEPADFVWIIPPPAMQEKRIYLGVQIQKTSDNKLIIEAITPESPAEKVGFKTGDVILSVDGKMVKSVMELVHYLQTKHFGDTCTVVIERNGNTISCEVSLFEIKQK
ncbi:MAG: PDZ domain-containing protein [Candidatus Brocadia sp.]|nr:MAG: PDZ domain-containing protein [Candidatus Brocadia sp.]